MPVPAFPFVAAALLLAAAPDPAKPAISVLYFDNATGQPDYDVLRKGLADMISADLVAWDGVTVVERERLEEVLAELKLQRGKSFDQATAVRVGKLLGAQYLLTGTITLSGPELRLNARLIRAQGGDHVVSAVVRGPKDKVFDLEQELVDRITEGIDVKVKNVAARRRVKVPDLEALLAYSRAIDLSDQGKVEEAQKAMQALVSRSPSFLLAREKREQILKDLEEQARRRADTATASVLKLGEIAEAGLADEARYDTLDEAGQRRWLTLRLVRAQVLARLLKQHLSSRDEDDRVVLKGHEAPALEAMRAWAENHRRFVAEHRRFRRALPVASPGPLVDRELGELLRDARMQAERFDPMAQLFSFVVLGRCWDGPRHFAYAPPLGELDKEEEKAAFALLDKEIDAALAMSRNAADDHARRLGEHTATRFLQDKARGQFALGLQEEGIATLQRILDAFPNGFAAERTEEWIKEEIGARHDWYREISARWAKAMKNGCADDMDVNASSIHVLNRRLGRQGLGALAAHAAELEKACKPDSLSRRRVFARVYRDLSHLAARHDDCEGYRHWARRCLDLGGSVSETMAWAKSYPWCELGDVVRSVQWLYARLDRHWNVELDHGLGSSLSHDRKRLTLAGDRVGRPDKLRLYLDAATPGGPFTCAFAQWQSLSSEEMVRGSCTVALTRLASGPADFDEGTFTATFEVEGPPRRRVEMTEGRFRLRRR